MAGTGAPPGVVAGRFPAAAAGRTLTWAGNADAKERLMGEWTAVRLAAAGDPR
ncbi:hypothetical protein GCM10010106_08220 [Thermopolyspora flexuosa]|uniref:hypothetical protein n=1 Tax=Thermopolyspora flexuosa TaxID=103836 RepID=UPI001476847B|nr:hypothetical protein [Thermopolyspora flexuosa]GGM64650.1 hypothetical protein GCM10010106_08220 [Thermopolyspora flexuosa]